MKPDIDYGVYLVTDTRLRGGRDLLDVVREALLGGVTAVQFREKECGTSEFI
ncbi:MAG: thiamine phosphate synthase, partial [Thermodesulfobacteriota bacterium]|nr:thiamine phosphate synthase [Thermodesulfobacteriota bacterium]